jgi:hypothetical protein
VPCGERCFKSLPWRREVSSTVLCRGSFAAVSAATRSPWKELSAWANGAEILQPTEHGFEERLEVDPGGGKFIPYYTIVVRKITAHKPLLKLDP